MNTTITLDEKHFHLIEAEASALGMSPAEFIHALMDARKQTLGETLESDDDDDAAELVPDDELDELFADPAPLARKQ